MEPWYGVWEAAALAGDLLDLVPERTALVTIDLQEGILAMPVAPHPAAEVVARTAAVAEALRRVGGFVVLVHVGPSPDGKDALHPQTDRKRAGGDARPQEGWDRIVASLGPQEGDHVVRKRQWGAFYGTDLDLELRRRGIDTVLLTGIATNMGVESTARDAYERGYNLVFVEDAMSSLEAGMHAFAIEKVFPLIGRVRNSHAVLAELGRAGSGS